MSTATHDIPVDEPLGDADFCDNLRRVLTVLMTWRDIEVPELAEKSGIPKSTFYKKLGEGSFSAHQVFRIGKALSVKPEVFYMPVSALMEAVASNRCSSHLSSVDPVDTAHQLALLHGPDMKPYNFIPDLELVIH